jgi:hypothetical protein
MKKVRDLFQTEIMTDLKKYQLISKQHENTFQDSKVPKLAYLHTYMHVIPEDKEMLLNQEVDGNIGFKTSEQNGLAVHNPLVGPRGFENLIS